jgi:hypothetical protein
MRGCVISLLFTSAVCMGRPAIADDQPRLLTSKVISLDGRKWPLVTPTEKADRVSRVQELGSLRSQNAVALIYNALRWLGCWVAQDVLFCWSGSAAAWGALAAGGQLRIAIRSGFRMETINDRITVRELLLEPATDRWAQKVLDETLDVEYYHLVLSVPWQLRTLTLATGLVFHCQLTGICILSLLFGWRMMPETKGRTLEDIAEFWRKP